MAATVYNGKGNVTHTNSSGGNQRIMIYWIYRDDTDSVEVKWGNLSGNHNIATMDSGSDQYVGLNLAYSMVSGNPNSYGTQIGEKSYSSSANISGKPVPMEVFIANGEGFSITTPYVVNPGAVIKGYNFVVLDE